MDSEQKNSDQGEKVDEIVLPGFRFHPTDEELVGFYLKRKIQQRPLSIELIKQLDIYKYDPWDLPKMAASGEKEWYFYCPRDRKYRNSTRPNRVTKAGFWKATGTDRPVYSSEPSKCIGLKKSLVFYKGRAAKGTKTDWMMHEFRLPPSSSSLDTKRSLTTSTSESWAICRIFRKTSSVTHRSTTSRSWISPSISSSQPNLILNSNTTTTATSSPYTDQITPENNAFVSMKTEPHPSNQMGSNGEYYSNEAILNIPPDYYNHQHITMLPPLMDATLPYLTHLHKVNDHHLNNNNSNGDISCVLGEDYLVNSSSNFNDACMSLQLEGLHDQLLVGNGVVFSNGTPLMMQEELLQGGDFDRRDDLWDVVKSFRFPISSDIGIL